MNLNLNENQFLKSSYVQHYFQARVRNTLSDTFYWAQCWLVEIYFIIDGDVSSSVEQCLDHVDMFVLCRPNDGCPATTVLKPTKKK